ncbi:MAG: hypothetical protein ACJ8BW_31335, partial [Ktedonobacteraceae bacterium]
MTKKRWRGSIRWPPTLERLWRLFFGDDSVESRRGGEGHLTADLLKRVRSDSRLEVLRRLPLCIDMATVFLTGVAILARARLSCGAKGQTTGVALLKP